jgi:predicted dehydrogenase
MTGIAFAGTGFVADYYMTTLKNHKELTLVGAWDHNADRLSAFSRHYAVHAYDNLEALLRDPRVDVIVNLTTPESHFIINKAALEAKRHVYCEKPLALSLKEAQALIALADHQNRIICGAPANGLSDAFQLTKELLDGGKIGKPRLVYAEMEDGPVFRANWQEWRSVTGVPWPGLHEFEVGCTLEHAGYGLSWLVGLFGPVAHVASFSATTFPDKGQGTEHIHIGPDFSVGCLTFKNGVVARITCGLAAPRDRSLTLMGDAGTLTVRDLWDNRSPINLAADDERSFVQKIAGKLEAKLHKTLPLRLPMGKTVAYPRKNEALHMPGFPSQIDFARGIQQLSQAIQSGNKPFFSGNTALHLTELALAINAGEPDYKPQTSF